MSKLFKRPEHGKVQAAALEKVPNLKPTPPKTTKRDFKGSTRANFKFLDYIWISLMWLGISYLWGSVNGVILPNLNSRYIAEDIKGTMLGIITALGMVVAIVVQPAAGALSDVNQHLWGRRRPYMLVGGISVVLVLIIMAAMVVFFGNWWMLLLFYLLLQFSDNVVQGAYQGIIPDCVPPSRRGRASGAMGIAQILGNVSGLAVATLFIDLGRIELALLLIALVVIVTLVSTFTTIREEPLRRTHESTSNFKIILKVLHELRNYPDFIRFIVSRLCVLTALATLTIFALYYLQDVMGKREGTLTESYTLLGVVIITCSLLSIMPAVWLGDQIGRKRLIIIACGIGATGMVLLATATDMTQVMLYGSLIGIATGSFNSLDWALATDLIPQESAGRFMGISNLAGAGSQALAALLGGGMRDGFNAIGTHLFNLPHLGYTALFLMGTCFFLLGIFFLRGVKDPAKSKVS
ncbi:MAG: MFS transporter [Chloroflexi bacterium]|uniref:MFS transporter n=1 Tax=Candidatus Chlorohelix allophototropha TaxID=3003348 RepID=A0A8T7LRT1_9CHLR|nr:MFS transporter [Chloroflexota bacterium]WJW66586.1 MFS transporter [Chloroflexota bacterium L227-S17]